MSSDRLYQLGLFVRRSASGVKADLPLDQETLINPMTGMRIEQASFMVVSDRLMALDPPEMVGLPPIALSDFDTPGQLRNWVVADFKRMVAELERRSAELRALKVEPKIDPETLHLTAEVTEGDVHFEISSDKRGNFRLARAVRNGEDFNVPGTQTFELSDYQDRASLVRHLMRLVGLPGSPEEPPFAHVPRLYMDEVARAFGEGSLLPPRSPLELLVEFTARGVTYRFAAARVQGRTFRGLLAGPEGKVWAERFEIDQFPGVRRLAAHLLRVSEAEIQIARPPASSLSSEA
ncbi:MAG: hypothetical protein IRZ16_06685 [Myxococcaceae bacterium]|nr:hypothetical protein [Myxococcaceae bacterium]